MIANGISEGGEIRRLKDGKIFGDVHVSATGKLSATEKITGDVVKRISEAPPEVITDADPLGFEAWDPENTNPVMMVARGVGIGDVVEWSGLFAVVEAIEGSRAKLDAGLSAPVEQLKRVDAAAAIAAQRKRIEALVDQVRVMTEKIATQEEIVTLAAARVAKMTDDLKTRDNRVIALEGSNAQMEKRVGDLEKIVVLQKEKMVEVVGVPMRVYTLVYDPVAEPEKADEFMNLHLAHGGKHWTEVTLGNGKVMMRIASRKPGEKIIELPSEKTDKDEVAS